MSVDKSIKEFLKGIDRENIVFQRIADHRRMWAADGQSDDSHQSRRLKACGESLDCACRFHRQSRHIPQEHHATSIDDAAHAVTWENHG